MTPNLPRLRPAAPTDVGGLAEVERQLFGVDAWSVDAVEAELTATGGQVLVSTDQAGAISGYVVVRVVRDTADLLRIGVRRDHQRRGLGGLLLHAGLDAARAAGAERMLLEVAATNRAALALYRDHGFAELDRRRGYYRDGTDALILAVALTIPRRDPP